MKSRQVELKNTLKKRQRAAENVTKNEDQLMNIFKKVNGKIEYFMKFVLFA